MTLTKQMPKFQMPSTEEQKKQIADALLEIADQVTKKDRYQACINLARNNKDALDVRTINCYLKGEVWDIDFGIELVNYFRNLISLKKTKHA